MQITTDTINARNQVFDYILEDIPGGVSLDTTRLNATCKVLKAGTPVAVNKTTRVAEIVKTGTVVTGGSASIIYLNDDHHFAVGDYITDGAVSQTISSIVASGDNDYMVLGGNLLTYAAGTVIAEAESTSNFAYPVAASLGLGGDGGTLNFYSGNKYNAGLKFSINTNTGNDALAASYSAGTVAILAATGTTTKNYDNLIMDAIRDIATTDFDLSDILVKTSTWDGDDADCTGQSATMAATSGYKYECNGLIKDDVTIGDGATLYENVDCSVVMRGAVRNSAMPYPLSNRQKDDISLISFNY